MYLPGRKNPVDLGGIFEVKEEVGLGSLANIWSKYKILFKNVHA